jgi:type III pantothenate kinase
MLLLIDIGNTSTTIGFYSDGSIKNVFRLKTSIGGRNKEEYSYILNGFVLMHKIRSPEGAIISSVVPEVTPPIKNAVKKIFGIKALTVSCKIKTGLKFNIKNVERLGADRIADAVAAYRLYKGPLLVIDFGTATTFSYIDANGQFRGGAIMPGILLSADTLADRTARLPRIGLKGPDKALGKDTAESIRSGIILGHAGAVEKIIKEIKREVGRDFKVIITGGYANFMTKHIKIDHFNPLLTLEGLRIIYELNKGIRRTSAFMLSSRK